MTDRPVQANLILVSRTCFSAAGEDGFCSSCLPDRKNPPFPAALDVGALVVQAIQDCRFASTGFQADGV